MAAARIGKIRLKSGGAEVRVLHRDNPNRDGTENWRGDIIKTARIIAESGDDSDLVGYFIVGFFSDGASSVGFRYDPQRTPIPAALMPSWLAEVARRDMITAVEADQVACAVVNRSNGYEE